MNPASPSSRFRPLLAILFTACSLQGLFAGTEGSFMNSAGFGVAVDSVLNTYIDFDGQVVKTKVTVKTPSSQLDPCAAVNPQNFTCAYTAGLPSRTSRSVYCQSIGFPNYRWVVQAYVTGGATADNEYLESNLDLQAEDCAEIQVETDYIPEKSIIRVTGFGTAGSALGLRGYEVPEGVEPENKEQLLKHGELKFEILLPGPFVFSEEDCTTINIPLVNPDPERFYFMVDTVALSRPFLVSCPEEIVQFDCNEPVVYPLPMVEGGCGTWTATYHPPADQLPGGTTLVTVTVNDEAGNEGTCSFLAVRSLDFQGFQSPINGTGGTCSSPIRTLNRGSNLPVKFRTTCDGTNVDTGTPPYVRVYSCLNLSQPITEGSFQIVSNVWHFNWDTTQVAPGTYLIRAYLQDGTIREAYIRLR
jgi:hypothetical protein